MPEDKTSKKRGLDESGQVGGTVKQQTKAEKEAERERKKLKKEKKALKLEASASCSSIAYRCR